MQPETLAQYQAHVKRLKDAVEEPNSASFAAEQPIVESTNESEVVTNVEAQLIAEVASHAAAGPSAMQSPQIAMFQPSLPNSTRCVADGPMALSLAGFTKYNTALGGSQQHCAGCPDALAGANTKAMLCLH